MTGRVMIVTGANTGIGYEVARYLAEGGNDVVLACRDKDKGEDAANRIQQDLPNSLVTAMTLDLSSSTSIREFVREFARKKKKLSVLVNNAGMALNFKDQTRKTTKEGSEITMAVNHLGPFLLTNLLVDYLIQTAHILGDSRIINVTCGSHDHENSFGMKDVTAVDMDNFQLQKDGTFNGLQAYKNSKACNVMFSYQLADKLKGTRVSCNCIDPGSVPSTQLRRHSSRVQQQFSVCCFGGLLGCTSLSKSAKKAAQQICHLAIADKFEGETGKFYRDGVPDRSSIESYDVDLQKAVWRMSSKLMNIRSSNLGDDLDDISLS